MNFKGSGLRCPEILALVKENLGASIKGRQNLKKIFFLLKSVVLHLDTFSVMWHLKVIHW